MHRYRSHNCGEPNEALVGEKIRLSAGVIAFATMAAWSFIDLRDHYGLTQCVVDRIRRLSRRRRNALGMGGAARWRSSQAPRRHPKRRHADGTGRGFATVTEIEVLGPATELPVPVFGDQPYPEDTRLEYRFIDLRREKLHRNIMLRGRIVDSIRLRMKQVRASSNPDADPTASSPEGARDFLVPSRAASGEILRAAAGASAVQAAHHGLAGFDRYFQIAPCFRDEDERADRSPGEFYELDVEMSFVTQDDVFNAIEPVLCGTLRGVRQRKNRHAEISAHFFPRGDAEHGTDKPDLRNAD